MRLKFLLQPRWIGMILLIIVFSVLCFTVLAPWQFGRNDQTQAQISAVERSATEAPKPVQEVLPNGRAPDASTEWTKVTLHGAYLPAGETVAWLRTVNSDPAMEVLTPFRLDDGHVVLVDRGYLRPADTTVAPPYAASPPGPQTLVARVRVDETDSKNRPVFERDGHRWTYAVSSRIVGAGTGITMQPGYFALVDSQPGVLAPLPLPVIDSGPFFSYALQWITFGIMAPIGVGYLIYSELRPSPDGERRPIRPKQRRKSVAQTIAEEERKEREEAASQG